MKKKKNVENRYDSTGTRQLRLNSSELPARFSLCSSETPASLLQGVLPKCQNVAVVNIAQDKPALVTLLL